MGQVEEFGEPVFLGSTDMRDHYKVVGAANRGSHRNLQDVDQRLLDLSATPRVAQLRKTIQQ